MNRAAQKLREILQRLAKDERGAYQRLALEIGATPDMLSKWLADRHRPAIAYRAKLQQLHGIDMLDWDVEVDDGEAQPEAS